MFVAAFPRNRRAVLPSDSEIGRRLRRNFPDGQPLLMPAVLDHATGLTLYAWLRLDNPEDLEEKLGGPVTSVLAPRGHPHTSTSPSLGGSVDDYAPAATNEDLNPRFARDAALLLAAYVKWGPDCVEHLEGDFSFAIYDSRDESVFLARDAVGIRPLYVAVTEDLFVASPSAGVFDLFQGIDTSIRWEWLADYIHGMSGDWRETPFVGVQRLPPGHCMRVTHEGLAERAYHEFDGTSAWEDTRDPRWLEAYRSELIRAVSVRTEPDGLIGVEISGGLDSSTILGVMAHAHPERINDIHTFGFVFDELEPEYILETSSAHGIVQNHIFTGVGRGVDRHRAWLALGYPSEVGNALSHVPFYKLATQLGVNTLHSGHGGDEIVTSSGQLALEELKAQGAWKQLMRDTPGPKLIRPARVLWQGSRRRANAPLPENQLMARLDVSPLRDEIRAARALESRAYRAISSLRGHSKVNDLVLTARYPNLKAIRTADSSLVAASFGVDYRWALLDRRLVQQYLTTPSVWKFGSGHGRYLHRRALAGMVPEKVVWKGDKDMGAPRQPSLRQLTASSHARIREWRRGAMEQVSVAGQELLHPQLAEITDAERVEKLRKQARSVVFEAGRSATARASLRMLTNLEELSAWLTWRDS